jgi:hypothetical protein
MRSAEITAQQTSVIVSPRPAYNASSTAVRSEGQTKHEISVNGNSTADLPVVSYGHSDEFDIQVRIERGITRDARPPYGEPTDQGLYATPPQTQTVWDINQDGRV